MLLRNCAGEVLTEPSAQRATQERRERIPLGVKQPELLAALPELFGRHLIVAIAQREAQIEPDRMLVITGGKRWRR